MGTTAAKKPSDAKKRTPAKGRKPAASKPAPKAQAAEKEPKQLSDPMGAETDAQHDQLVNHRPGLDPMGAPAG